MHCEDEYVEELDRMEAVGILYERRSFHVETYLGESRTAFAYVAIPGRTATEARPSRRYRNLIVAGGREVGLNAAYIEWLSNLAIHPHPTYPLVEPPIDSPPSTSGRLSATSRLTRTLDRVFPFGAAPGGELNEIGSCR